jgi:hypothetical protein
MATETVLLARRMSEISAKLPPEDRAVLEEVWVRMEHGETDAGFWKAKYNGTWPEAQR